MVRLMSGPRVFFSTEALHLGLKRPLLVVLVSSAVYAVASMASRMPAHPLLWGGVLFINAVGMVVITAAAGFVVMAITVGRRVPFGPFFSIYALSSSAALLLAWVPFGPWIAEVFKWWLVGTGLNRALGFKLWHSAVIMGASIIGVVVIFQSILQLSGSG